MAEEDGDVDRGLWYYARYLDVIGRLARLRGEEKETRERVLERVEIIDPLPRALDRAISVHVRNLEAVARNYERRGLYGSAVRAYLQVQSLRPLDHDVTEAITRIREEGGADVAVEDVRGGADPLAELDSASIAEHDAAHSTWETAARKKTLNYTIVSDAGLEVLETVALVMEQMNRYYREVFRYGQDGEPTPHIEAWVFRDQAEFMQVLEVTSKTLGGFYDGSKVTAFDGGGSGKSRLALYETLFHEAAHQFVDLAGGDVPKWVNEGIASYFEGAKILSNKQVVSNLVAQSRLMALHGSLSGGDPEAVIPLRRLLTIGHGGYGGEFYPYGWGLVYFLMNFEDADGERVYRDLFDEYFKSFLPPVAAAEAREDKGGDGPTRRRSRGGKEEEDEPAAPPAKSPEQVEFERLSRLAPIPRFEEFFLTRAAVPGIADLETFEQTFHRFIDEIYRLETGDRAFAEEQLALAARRIEEENWDSAAGILERVVQAHPSWPEALWMLFRVAREQGRRDRCLNLLRDLVAATARPADPDAELRDEAEGILVDLDPLKQRWVLIDRKLEKDLDEVVTGYLDAKLPLVAMHCLEKLRQVRRYRHAADARIAAIEADSGCSTRRWKLLFNEVDLEGWYGGTVGSNYRVEDGLLLGRVTDADRADEKADLTQIVYRLLFVDQEIEGDFEFEAEALSLRDAATSRHCRLLGLTFGARSTEQFHALNFLPFGTIDFGAFQGAWDTERQLTDIYPEGQWIRLRIEVTGDRVRAFLDGEQRFDTVLPPGAVRGDFGVLTGDGSAAFRNMRLRARW
jgi:tetratricopeptide (TPR) repeat protein